MLEVPTQNYSVRNEVALVEFLKKCKDAAVTKNHFQIASISLNIKHIDPLVVLESIYEPEELHFYLEHPSKEETIAGAEAIASSTFFGPERFQKSKTFADSIIENTIAIGDLDSPMSGLCFFCSFTFFDKEESSNSAFPAATIFVPRWQVSSHNGIYTAVANLRVELESDVIAMAQKVWAAYIKFSSFHYQKAQPSRASTEGKFETQEVGGEGWYESAAAQGVQKIKSGNYQKIVLARAVDLIGETTFDALNLLNKLRNQYPHCFLCSVANGKGQSFIAVTPERLLRIQNGVLSTEAVAGTAPRGQTAQEDVQFENALLDSEKDLREHELVLETIVKNLEGLGVKPVFPATPKLKKLANVQHLNSPITAKVSAGIHLLDIVGKLHPTPAVGGTPLEKALDGIKSIENFDRGLYAGTVGWFDHKGEGEFVVSIRSALIDNNKARVYAGSGIVEASIPEKERKETDLKIQAILDNLQ